MLELASDIPFKILRRWGWEIKIENKFSQLKLYTVAYMSAVQMIEKVGRFNRFTSVNLWKNVLYLLKSSSVFLRYALRHRIASDWLWDVTVLRRQDESSWLSSVIQSTTANCSDVTVCRRSANKEFSRGPWVEWVNRNVDWGVISVTATRRRLQRWIASDLAGGGFIARPFLVDLGMIWSKKVL